ncbi:MAG: hypothetical protein AAGE76_11945 [Pseudomonadota bacterium]
MTKHIVKIFGERNTGTRAAIRLVRQVEGVSLRVRARETPPVDTATEVAIEGAMKGHWKRLYLQAMADDLAAPEAADDPWKHAVPRLTPAMRAARVKTLILVRDPYSWLLGLARRPYHIKGPNAESLEDFVARPWLTEGREGMPAVVASPVDLWRAKTSGGMIYRDTAIAAGLACEILRFEDFLADPAGSVIAALQRMDVDCADLRPARTNTKRGEADLSRLQAYYAAEAWRVRFSRETVARVNARLDAETVAAAGYALRDPADFAEAVPAAERAAMRREMENLTTPTHGGGSDRETGAAAAT